MSRKCFWHGTEEQVNQKTFLQCEFCAHVFQTEEIFRKEALALQTPEYDDNGKEIEGFYKQTWPDDTKTKDIHWCPFCGGVITWKKVADEGTPQVP
jgi:hypothetical protein